MKRREIFLTVVVVVLVGILVFLHQSRKSDLKQLATLMTPQIISLQDQNMLVVEATGDPSEISKPAISQLYKDYYELRLNGKRLPRVAARARWNVTDMTARNTWQATFALPLPIGAEPQALLNANAQTTAKIVPWQYGDVAEILHVGAYEKEPATIQTLQKFITDNGYKIVGDLEEEYLKGPGMFLKGNPNQYYTVLRYRVVKN